MVRIFCNVFSIGRIKQVCHNLSEESFDIFLTSFKTSSFYSKNYKNTKTVFAVYCSIQQKARVGHCVFLCSERIVLLHSFKERNILLSSFFEFLAAYETQKNDAFFS